MSSYTLNEETMFCDIADGVAIVINSETGIYYGMNEFGTSALENILNGVAVEKVLAAMQSIPGAPADMPQRLKEFVAILVSKKIVLPHEGIDAQASIDAKAAQENAFALEVKEYDDAQELLLADPIHEVKEAEGWQPTKDALATDMETVVQKENKME